MGYKYSFEKLEVWKNSRELVLIIYKITSTFPKEEKYSLIDQMRRSSISISSNLAEGSSRFSKKDKRHYINISYSSLMELLSQLYVVSDLSYITSKELELIKERIYELSNKLNAYRKFLLSG